MASVNITDFHVDYAVRQVHWAKIRDALEGEDKVKDQGEQYLPKPSGMDQGQYNAYKTRASFYAVGDRTLRGLTGMVFRHEPVVKVPTRMEPMLDNLTVDRYSLNVLADEIVREVLSVGRYGLLLDFARESTSQALPYIATYYAEDIINWEQEYYEDRKVVTRVVLKDDIDNAYGEDVKKYLELLLVDNVYTMRRWEIKYTAEGNATGQEQETPAFQMTDELQPSIGGKTLNYIPFVFVNPYDMRPDITKAPFLDLVNMNLSHYRNSADYEHALYLTAQPTPWVSGEFTEENKPRSIGSGTIWYLSVDGKAGMLEFEGSGIEAQRQAMDDKEKRMASLGARMINDSSTRQETAETARLRGRGETSLLTSTVNMVTEALNNIMKRAAEWTGSNPEDVEIDLNNDFVETRLTPEELNALVKSWQSGAISYTTLYRNLQKGEIVEPDRDMEDEQTEIDDEAMKSIEEMVTRNEALAETSTGNDEAIQNNQQSGGRPPPGSGDDEE